MRVLISGGGTGGHIYPALSVAALLQEKYQADILYLGSDDGLETRSGSHSRRYGAGCGHCAHV